MSKWGLPYSQVCQSCVKVAKCRTSHHFAALPKSIGIGGSGEPCGNHQSFAIARMYVWCLAKAKWRSLPQGPQLLDVDRDRLSGFIFLELLNAILIDLLGELDRPV